MRDSLSPEPPAAPGVGRLGLRPLPPAPADDPIVTVHLTAAAASDLEGLLSGVLRRQTPTLGCAAMALPLINAIRYAAARARGARRVAAP